MKKVFLAFFLLILGLWGSLNALSEGEADLAEWTWMCYFCGSDLESGNGLATANLREFILATPPQYIDADDNDPQPIDWDALETSGAVNTLIQTGGSAEWHSREALGFKISNQKLQRYQYLPKSLDSGLELVMELPLQSMAAPDTLADFIRWGVENYPARRYGLLLWDHGDGARTGLFIDELFDGDVMYLYELKQALEMAGASFEAVVFDACMMANLETACAVRDHARWMVASEELLSGHGIDYESWLTQLYTYAKVDGRQMGRMLCNTTQAKYANLSNPLEAMTLTLSVIDLSKLDAVLDCFDRMFAHAGKCYEADLPAIFSIFSMIGDSEHYSNENTHMVDIGSMLYAFESAYALGPDLRNEFVRALDEAVVYNVRGNARPRAQGMSFCAGMDLTAGELDVYAKNCPSPHYLALLDALQDRWDAPPEVYERAQRLTPLSSKQTADPVLSLEWLNAQPSIRVIENPDYVSEIRYRLCYQDENTEQTISLGTDSCNFNTIRKEQSSLYEIDIDKTWPSIDGNLCCIERLWEDSYMALYNIPIRMEETVYNLRCGYVYNTSLIDQWLSDASQLDYSGKYRLYGVWEGYNEDSEMSGRNTITISQLHGREFQLLYPVMDGGGYTRFYQNSPTRKMYRGMEVTDMALPVGSYTITFIVSNIFMQSATLDPIELYWDGEQFIPLKPWTGTISHFKALPHD